MSNKNEPDIFEQMSIFQIMNLLDDPENTFSSEDISKIIDKLSGVKRKKNLSKQRRDSKKSVRDVKEKLVKQRNVRKPISEKLPVWIFLWTGITYSIPMCERKGFTQKAFRMH